MILYFSFTVYRHCEKNQTVTLNLLFSGFWAIKLYSLHRLRQLRRGWNDWSLVFHEKHLEWPRRVRRHQTFTCPVDGLYKFLSHHDVALYQPHVQHQDGRWRQHDGLRSNTDRQRGTCPAFLRCEQGQQVWVESKYEGDAISNSGRHYSCFSGALLRTATQ